MGEGSVEVEGVGWGQFSRQKIFLLIGQILFLSGSLKTLCAAGKQTASLRSCFTFVKYHET